MTAGSFPRSTPEQVEAQRAQNARLAAELAEAEEAERQAVQAAKDARMAELVEAAHRRETEAYEKQRRDIADGTTAARMGLRSSRARRFTTAKPPRSFPVLGADRIILAGKSHLLTAPPKAGKSTLLGQCFGDWIRADEYATVLCFTEETFADWDVRKALHGFTDEMVDRLDIIEARKESPSDMVRYILEVRPTVVCVDTARGILGVEDENSNSEVASALDRWVRACREVGAALIVVHHAAKGSKGGAGATAWASSLDATIDIAARKGTRRTVDVVSRTYPHATYAYTKGEDGLLAMAVDQPGDTGSAAPAVDVTTYVTRPSMTTAEIMAAHSAPKPSIRTLQLRLGTAADAGLLERSGGAGRSGSTWTRKQAA